MAVNCTFPIFAGNTHSKKISIKSKYTHTNMLNINKRLILAAGENNKERVKQMLRQGADINSQYESDKTTALMRVCSGGYHDIAALLMAYNPNLELKNKNGDTALALAIAKERLDIAQLLIAAQANVNTVNEFHESPLILACSANYLEGLSMLIDKGAHVNIKTDTGDTPLVIATINESLPIIKKLVQNNADLYKRNKKGKTVIDIAQQTQSENIKSFFNYIMRID